MKASALFAIILSVIDDIVDIVVVHSNPMLAWEALKTIYHSGDHSQILILTS